MAVLDILTYPHPILRNHSRPIGQVDERIRKLLDDLAETMYAAPGIGLAAPQVGLNLRVVVVDVEWNNDGKTAAQRDTLYKLIDPEILERHGKAKGKEGCLSFPGLEASVERAERILVRTLNLEGHPIEFTCDGLLAVAIQHELDHLDGVLLIDNASPLKRRQYKHHLRKQGVLET